MAWLVESVGLQVETFASGDEFLRHFDPSLPCCLVIDVRMPGMSGLELQNTLKERGAGVPIIVMTAYGDVSTAVRAMKRGAFDFIEKPFQDQQMIDLIHACLAADASRRRAAAKWDAIERCIGSLTRRERQVLDLVVAGRSNKEVAIELGIVPKTVEAHRANVMKKMGAGSLAELVTMMARWVENTGNP